MIMMLLNICSFNVYLMKLLLCRRLGLKLIAANNATVSASSESHDLSQLRAQLDLHIP